MTTIYLIRHAQSDGTVQDESTRPLTEAGLAQADALANRLSGIAFDAVYSSPYLRAMQTVAPLGFPVVPLGDFRERAVFADDQDESLFIKRQWADFDYALDQGESNREAQDRAISALHALVAERGNQTVAVGTHGGLLAVILNHFDGTFGYEQYLALLPKLPCVYRLAFEADQLVDMEEI